MSGGKTKVPLMRDVFVETICAAAKKDRDLFFVSADFGAAALDALRAELPGQFVHAGISEQNMVDFASGLSLSGKKVFLYAMAPFITARCYEQVKCCLSAMNQPVTLIAVGVGLGYDHATLTHFTPEDIAIMRALNHIEVLTPADAESAGVFARESIAKPRLRYVRLERNPLPTLYQPGELDPHLGRGFVHLAKGTDVALVACGMMTHSALKAREALREKGISAGVIDLFRIKPLDGASLCTELAGYSSVVTVEEQNLEGGFGGAVLEAMADQGFSRPVRRIGLADGFEVKNGHREFLHSAYGLDVPSIVSKAESVVKRVTAAA